MELILFYKFKYKFKLTHFQDCRAVPYRLGEDSVYSSEQLWTATAAVLGIVWTAVLGTDWAAMDSYSSCAGNCLIGTWCERVHCVNTYRQQQQLRLGLLEQLWECNFSRAWNECFVVPGCPFYWKGTGLGLEQKNTQVDKFAILVAFSHQSKASVLSPTAVKTAGEINAIY